MMSKPEIHTFGIAKYVYASAYDQIEAERDELKAGRASFFDVHAKMQDRLSDAEADNAKLYRVYDLQADKIKRLKADNAATLETLREVTDVIPKTITREIWNGGAMSEADIEQVVRDEIAKAREGGGALEACQCHITDPDNWPCDKCSTKAREARGDDCPNCPNQGWYYVGRHAEQEQCEWCWVNPNSKFTKARSAQEGAERVPAPESQHRDSRQPTTPESRGV